MKLPLTSIPFTKIASVYVAFGVFSGIFVIYPLTMMIVWLEFSHKAANNPALADFMTSRFLFGFLPKFEYAEMIALFSILGGFIGLCFAAATYSFARQSRSLKFLLNERQKFIPQIIQSGETENIEFKSSLRWDMRENCVNKSLETVIAKALAGFFNSRGGDLLIGVADDGTIIGLSADYSTLKHENADGFERAVTDIVTKKLGGDLSPKLHFTFAPMSKKEVCMISVEPATRAVYLQEGNNQILYVRAGNSTRKLDVKEALDYARTRWK
ncbi:MAG: ATP-binding protein [Sneathiella sp.]